MKDSFKERIGYSGELNAIAEHVAEAYDLGEVKESKLVLLGYEDFNFILTTEKDTFFVKVFAQFRSTVQCKQYIEKIAAALHAGVSTPQLLSTDRGYLYSFVLDDVELKLCVMDYIEGLDLYTGNTKLTEQERGFLAEQAAKINQIRLHPEFIYDSWSIVNFEKEYREKKQYLVSEDYVFIKELAEQFEQIELNKLPHAFVHGDIINTNVVKDKEGDLWIIDFAVANWYPRIQELALLGCNILFDEHDKETSEKQLRLAIDAYQKIIPLTEEELHILPLYIKLAHAMHVLCASYEKFAEDNTSKENEYWLNQGRKGLRQ